MKFCAIVVSIFMLMFSVSAWSDAPCKTIEAACKAAGYYKGGASAKKGLLQDCIKPITEGQTVANIQIDPKVASACKAKLTAHGY